MGARSWRKQAGRSPVCGCRGGTDCTIRRFAYCKPPVPTFLLRIRWVVVSEGASYLANKSNFPIADQMGCSLRRSIVPSS